MHAHHRQEEAISIINGKMGYQITGEEARYAFEGKAVKIPRGKHIASGMPEMKNCSSVATNCHR